MAKSLLLSILFFLFTSSLLLSQSINIGPVGSSLLVESTSENQYVEFSIYRSVDENFSTPLSLNLSLHGYSLFPIGSSDVMVYDEDLNLLISAIEESAQVTIPPNIESITIRVASYNDEIEEDIEGFNLIIMDPSIGAIVSSMAQGVVLDNDQCSFQELQLQGDYSSQSIGAAKIEVLPNSNLNDLFLQGTESIEIFEDVVVNPNTILEIASCLGIDRNLYIDPSLLRTSEYEIVSEGNLSLGDLSDILISADSDVISQIEEGKLIFDPTGSGHLIMINEVLETTNLKSRSKFRHKTNTGSKAIKGFIVPMNVLHNGGTFAITGNENSAKKSHPNPLNPNNDDSNELPIFDADLGYKIGSKHGSLEVVLDPINFKSTIKTKLDKKVELHNDYVTVSLSNLDMTLDPSMDLKAEFSEMDQLAAVDYFLRLNPLANAILIVYKNNILPGNLESLDIKTYTDFKINATIDLSSNEGETGEILEDVCADNSEQWTSLFTKSVPYFAGPVPFVLNTELEVALSNNFGDAASIGLDLKKEYFMYSDLSINDLLGTKNFNFNSESGQSSAQFIVDIGFDVRLIFRVNISFKALGLVGPKVSPKAYFGFEAAIADAVSTNPENSYKNLSAGIYYGASGCASVDLGAFQYEKSIYTFDDIFSAKGYFYKTPHSIEIVSGNNQSSFQGLQLSEDLVVKVSDSDGNPPPIPVPVKFYAPQDGLNTSPQYEWTNAEGIATLSWTPEYVEGSSSMDVSISYGSSDLITSEFSYSSVSVVFESNQAEIEPIVLFPRNNELISESPLLLTWEVDDSPIALSWEVYFDGTKLDLPIDIDDDILTLYSVYLNQSYVAGLHEWYVIAKDGQGNIITQSDIWEFTIVDIAFTAVSPSIGEVLSESPQLLTWQVDNYDEEIFWHVYLNDELMTSPLIWDQSISPPTFSQQVMNFYDLSPGQYTWKVIGENADGHSLDESTTWTFSIDDIDCIPDLSSDLIAYYPFDSDALDHSGIGNNLSEGGSVTYEAGRFNNALKLDAEDEYVGIANLDIPATNTFSMWFQIDDVPTSNNWPTFVSGNNTISCNNDDVYTLLWQPERGNQIAYRYQCETGTVSQVDLDDNQWHHIVHVVRADKRELYLDGVLVDSHIATSTTNQVMEGLVFGREQDSPLGGWQSNQRLYGSIDEVKIYGRDLCPAEILDLYNYDICETPALSSGLVAYYPFNGNAQDATAFARHGDPKGDAILTDDVGGNPSSAYYFDGDGDYIEIDNPFHEFDKEMSVSWWVQADDFQNGSGISQSTLNIDNTSTSDVWQIQGFTSGQIGFIINDQQVWRGYNPVPNFTLNSDWHHLVGTISATESKIYVDGQLVISGDGISSQIFNNPNSVMHIGRDSRYPSGRSLEGKIDEVRIYNRVLCPEEVTELYGDGSCTPDLTSDLVADYPFNGNANDASGNNHNSTVIDASMTTDRFGQSNSAYSFDGDKDSITVPADSDFWPGLNDYSVSVWVKYESDAFGQRVFNTSHDAQGSIPWVQLSGRSDQDELRFSLKSGNNSTQTTVTATGFKDGQWHHIVGVRRNVTTLEIYKDGILEESVTNNNLGNVSSTSDFPMYIGYAPHHETFSNDGDIDDLRFYSKALCPEEITELYHKNGYQALSDLDGNSYNITTIGSQTWMAENLRTTKYSDGTTIAKFGSNNSPKRYEYQNDESLSDIYGFQYNFHAVKSAKNICPSGWHVPTLDEWNVLLNYIEPGAERYNNSVGNKLKEKGTAHWKTSSAQVTDQFGFKALPGGSQGSQIYSLTERAFWWTSTPSLPGNNLPELMRIYHDSGALVHGDTSESTGLSVRCVKDDE